MAESGQLARRSAQVASDAALIRSGEPGRATPLFNPQRSTAPHWFIPPMPHSADLLGHSSTDWAIVAVFAIVYLGMFLGGLPRLKLDRSGVALLGAIAVIALAGLPV